MYYRPIDVKEFNPYIKPNPQAAGMVYLEYIQTLGIMNDLKNNVNWTTEFSDIAKQLDEKGKPAMKQLMTHMKHLPIFTSLLLTNWILVVFPKTRGVIRIMDKVTKTLSKDQVFNKELIIEQIKLLVEKLRYAKLDRELLKKVYYSTDVKHIFSVEYADSEEHLIKKINEHLPISAINTDLSLNSFKKAATGYLLGIVFQVPPPDYVNSTYNVSYTFRPHHQLRTFDTIWSADYRFPPFSDTTNRIHGGSRGGPPYYYDEGLLTLQSIINEKIIEDQTGEKLMTNIFIKKFAHPNFVDDDFVHIFNEHLPILIVACYTFSVVAVARYIVSEKESGLSNYLRLHGVSNLIQLIGYFIRFIPIFIYISCILCGSFKIPIKVYNGPFKKLMLSNAPFPIILMFYICYSISSISFACACGAIFHRSTSAAVGTTFIWLTSYLPFFNITMSYDSISYFNKVLACLVPNLALGISCKIFSSYDINNVKMKWDNIFQEVSADNSIAIGYVMIMLCLSNMPYVLITVYLMNIWPGKYGVAKHYLYPFKWHANELSREKNDFIRNSDFEELVEELPANLEIGICVRNLRKVYPNGTVALDNLNIQMMFDEISVILGHNGAGKSTLVSILTGSLESSGGEIYINGLRATINDHFAHTMISLCPQYNILFHNLTVIEHLNLFLSLKHLQESQLTKRGFLTRNDFFENDKHQINYLLNNLDMSSKYHSYVHQLSGGQKRKLCVAIAMSGNSPCIILDEPSSGMDPEARKSSWQLYLKEKERGRCLVLTTHYMDEAEIVGDRIAILTQGKLVCYGSLLFLKQKYAIGYHLIMSVRANSDVRKIIKFIRDKLEEDIRVANTTADKYYSEQHQELSVVLPNSSVNTFNVLLKQLDDEAENLGILNYGLTVKTLEEIFLKIAEMHESAICNLMKRIRNHHSSESLFPQTPFSQSNQIPNVTPNSEIYPNFNKNATSYRQPSNLPFANMDNDEFTYEFFLFLNRCANIIDIDLDEINQKHIPLNDTFDAFRFNMECCHMYCNFLGIEWDDNKIISFFSNRSRENRRKILQQLFFGYSYLSNFHNLPQYSRERNDEVNDIRDHKFNLIATRDSYENNNNNSNNLYLRYEKIPPESTVTSNYNSPSNKTETMWETGESSTFGNSKQNYKLRRMQVDSKNYVIGFQLTLLQLYALLVKLFTISRRHIFMTIGRLLCVPIFVILATFIIQRLNIEGTTERKFDIKNYLKEPTESKVFHNILRHYMTVPYDATQYVDPLFTQTYMSMIEDNGERVSVREIYCPFNFCNSSNYIHQKNKDSYKNICHNLTFGEIDVYLLCIGHQYSLVSLHYQHIIGADLLYAERNTNMTNLTAILGYNNLAYHSAPTTVAMFYEAVSRYLANRSDVFIRTSLHPLPKTKKHIIQNRKLLRTEASVINSCILFGYTIVTAMSIMPVVRELKESQTKTIQNIMGVSSLVYFSAFFIYDMFFLNITSIFVLITFYATRMEAFMGIRSLIFWLNCNFYFVATIPLLHLVARLFRSPSAAFAFTFFFNFATSLILWVLTMILQNSKLKMKKLSDTIDDAFRGIFISYSFICSIADQYSNFRIKAVCEKDEMRRFCEIPLLSRQSPCCRKTCKYRCLRYTDSYFEWYKPGVTRGYLTFLAHAVFYTGLLLLLQSSLMMKIRSRLSKIFHYRILRNIQMVFSLEKKEEVFLRHLDDPNIEHVKLSLKSDHFSLSTFENMENMDQYKEKIIWTDDLDVQNEKKKVQDYLDNRASGNDQSVSSNPHYVVVLDNVTKVFKGNFIAVYPLTLGIQKSECFGLLGVNGAGKSTTFKMIIGETLPSLGDVYIKGHSIIKNHVEARKHIGYCSQIDTLFDDLTGEEHLLFYCRIRGLKWSVSNAITSYLIRIMNLENYAKITTCKYSMGNKRKLCTAITLIGNPAVILLDEPTSGMDVGARRFLWDVVKFIRQTTDISIVLTSHSMEECEALCTRLCIMVNGMFRCLGTVQELKSKFGDGYLLNIKLLSRSRYLGLMRKFSGLRDLGDSWTERSIFLQYPRRRKSGATTKSSMFMNSMNELAREIITLLGGERYCELKEINHLRLQFLLKIGDMNHPNYQNITISEVFRRLNMKMKENEQLKEMDNVSQFPSEFPIFLLLDEFTLCQTSLEQVFLSFAKCSLNGEERREMVKQRIRRLHETS
ncbi:hypothetical protein SNEBB_006888 [Seison nebaliae]|nr:hypothetical protein SNEBB_006888 [Seison nebaliae]